MLRSRERAGIHMKEFLKDSLQRSQVPGKTESGPRPWRTTVVPTVYRIRRKINAGTH